MRIKTNLEFVSFSDGICTIYSVDDDGNKVADKYAGLGFTDRTLGLKRFFEAAANQMKVTKVIRIPKLSNIDIYDKVEIGTKTYDIKLVQNIYDSNPVSMDLTLE